MCIAAVATIVLAAACGSATESGEMCVGARTYAAEPVEPVVEQLDPPVWTMEPGESTFSSPRAIDLNGDGVLDIVQGFGQDTLGARSSSVIATDGATGVQLWQSTDHEDLIGSPTFAELGGDRTPDVIIGGRRGALLGLDGADGSVLWSFDDQGGRWFNFYTSPIVDDQDGDGIVDIVAANGGLVFDEPSEGTGLPDPDQRQLGTIFLISGADGSVISSMPVPDRRESYMSAVVLPGAAGEGVDILFGTGGETLPGALWRIPLRALADDRSDEARRLVSSDDKGMIAAPSLADMNEDCVLDIVVQGFDGTISVVDGATDDLLWQVANEGAESYSSPTLGFFTGDDDIPDVFAAVAEGTWPEYTEAARLLIDGATGEVVSRTTSGVFPPSGAVAVDTNADGRDEVIYGVNDPRAGTQRVVLFDPFSDAHFTLGELDQTTFSALWIGDLDADGRLDLITVESAYESDGPARISRFDLPFAGVPQTISWGGYLGTDGTGALRHD